MALLLTAAYKRAEPSSAITRVSGRIRPTEAFNIANHPEYNDPGTDPTSLVAQGGNFWGDQQHAGEY